MKGKLPESKEITIKIDLEDAKECLKYLPPSLERVKNEIEKAIGNVNFWNFLRDCEHLEFSVADFHLTGLGKPGWHLYCKHPEHSSKERYLKDLPEEIRKLYRGDLPEDVRDKITGACNLEICPIYKR
ncbi:MAG: hypothetical protein DDT22_01217 [candidate division WS2 bacterium]|nr:hypothetical protein [Candidatus Lithacetigena glycinireducens]MBT9175537.1 hypothetical protein [Candidatus Lithacetigena glycinireducens]